MGEDTPLCEAAASPHLGGIPPHYLGCVGRVVVQSHLQCTQRQGEDGVAVAQRQ